MQNSQSWASWRIKGAARGVRLFILCCGLLFFWQALIWVSGIPRYILPAPALVATALFTHGELLCTHLLTTFTEIVLGLFFGVTLGVFCAVLMMLSTRLRSWLLPVLVISQAVPVFALAPVLVLWLGYGMASKVMMAVIIIFFPVTSTFYDGMRGTARELLDLAHLMGGGRLAILRTILIPSAMPALAAGVRVATVVAPIGAVIGEWVGSSGGLGYYMLQANARMQIDRMFAALFLLALVSVGFYFLMDMVLKKIIYWEHPTEVEDDGI